MWRKMENKTTKQTARLKRLYSFHRASKTDNYPNIFRLAFERIVKKGRKDALEGRKIYFVCLADISLCGKGKRALLFANL